MPVPAHSPPPPFARHAEATALIPASPPSIFQRLDDQERLAEHMDKPSLMLGGGRMTYTFDEGCGRTIGSHIRMGGQAFGVEVAVDEVVTERAPPRRKVWRTVGAPRLLIIGGYEMGFEIGRVSGGSRLRVWIDYDLAARGPGRWAPGLAAMYARWCVDRMVADASAAFRTRRDAERLTRHSAAAVPRP
jgi:hypothetical protein